MPDYILCLTTTNKKDIALRIAKELLFTKSAACVNIVGRVDSLYWWKGKVEEDREYLILIKTQAKKFQQVRRVIEEHHNYEVPELISLRIEKGLPPYLKWLTESLK